MNTVFVESYGKYLKVDIRAIPPFDPMLGAIKQAIKNYQAEYHKEPPVIIARKGYVWGAEKLENA